MRPGCALLLVLTALVHHAQAGEEFFRKVGIVRDFPREVRRGENLVLEGFLVRGFKDPELVLIAPDGRTYLNGDNDTTETEFTFTVQFEHGAGPYKMEILGHRPNTSRSAARFTVWYGRGKPRDGDHEPPVEERPPPRTLHPRLIEKQFAGWLQELRRKTGVPRAGWNEAVAARCREHAARMAGAHRKIHKFGGVGVREMLARDGAGPGGLSGPAAPWSDISDERPFPAPRPRSPRPGDREVNYVVVDVFGCTDPHRKFVLHYERLPAFRLKAVDPHCTGIAVGAARAAREPKGGGRRKGTGTRRDATAIYLCVAFVQVNDKRLLELQEEYYEDLVKRARREPSSELLRVLGNWSRPKAGSIVARHLGHERPAVAGAAHDGLMLLDARRAARREESAKEAAARLRERKEYGRAAALVEPFRYSRYDTEARGHAYRLRRELEREVLAELRALLDAPEAGRRRALRDLLERSEGLDAHKEVALALR